MPPLPIVHACPPATVDATATPVRSSCVRPSSMASIATAKAPGNASWLGHPHATNGRRHHAFIPKIYTKEKNLRRPYEGGAKNDHALQHRRLSTRPYPYRTQIKIIPPSSTHRYLPLLSRVRSTSVFWRCESGSSPLNVIFDMTPMALPTSLTAKTSTINVFLGAQTPNPGHLDQ